MALRLDTVHWDHEIIRKAEQIFFSDENGFRLGILFDIELFVFGETEKISSLIFDVIMLSFLDLDWSKSTDYLVHSCANQN